MATASTTKTVPLNASNATLAGATTTFNALLAEQTALMQRNTAMNVLSYQASGFAGTSADVYIVSAIVQFTTPFVP